MLVVNKHFVQEDEGVFLNKEGKEIFIQELESKMKSIITVKQIPYTYERLVNQEVYKLEKSILEKEYQYKPYKHQN